MNMKGHPRSYGKHRNLLVCQKVHLALPKGEEIVFKKFQVANF